MGSMKTIKVPVDLLKEVIRLSHCEADGNWCANHDAKLWPCPNEQLRRLVYGEK